MAIESESGKIDGQVVKIKKKHPTFLQNLNKYFSEYCDNTYIHGFKYIGDPGRLLFERICWATLFSVSLYLCVTLIIAMYKKWELTITGEIVSFAQKPTPVWEIPFPAVTICPQTKSRQTKFNFTKAFHQIKAGNISEDDRNNYSKVSLLCDNHVYSEGNKTTGPETVEYLKSIAPPFSEAMWICKWDHENETCGTMFSPVLTAEGICFTSNIVDREELLTDSVHLEEDYFKSVRKSEGWTLERGYPPNSKKYTYPRRVMLSGNRGAMIVLLSAYEYDLDYMCKGPAQGFKLLLHNPIEIPSVKSQYIRLPLNQEIVVSVQPEMVTTSEGLQNYGPHRRKCYLQSERSLLFFKGYTQPNCQLECLTNHTLKKCNCVAFYMPHEKETPICGSGSSECMRNAEDELLADEIKTGLSGNTGEGCDCLPSCTSIIYNADTSQDDFNWLAVFKAYGVDLEYPGMKMTRLTISFKEMQFITSERNELYGSTDFLANCGGLLGLFTGFSFLSMVEMIYFLTLRLICNIRKFGRHFWSGSSDLLEEVKVVPSSNDCMKP